MPLMGLTAAFVFAAQMINFPVAGGTSGHLIGAVLASALLGPSAAVVVITAVLVVQCFLFADGGVLALGANIFNMAIVGSIGGYIIYRAVTKLFAGEQGRLLGIGFASWCSTVVASVVCAGELAWSGTVVWSAAFPAMTGVHILIGAGEALITMIVIAAIVRVKPALMDAADPHSMGHTGLETFVYGSLIVLGLVVFVVPFASPWPDGLERVAATLGFEHKAVTQPTFFSPIAGYIFPGIGSPVLATVLAGAVGAVVAFLLAFILARSLTMKSASISAQTNGS